MIINNSYLTNSCHTYDTYKVGGRFVDVFFVAVRFKRQVFINVQNIYFGSSILAFFGQGI